MTIKRNEKVELTDTEMDLLHRARDLLNEIYHEASDSDICDPADTAADAITDLLDYCE